MIYTSYYANPKLKELKRQCVGVSRKHVKGFNYCTKLEPPQNIFNKYMAAKKTGNAATIRKAFKQYEAEYKRYLLTLDVHAAAKAFNGKILLCYEKDDSTCHRKWIRDWLKHFGYEAVEYGQDDGTTIDGGYEQSSTEKLVRTDTPARKQITFTWQDLKDAMWQEFFVKPFGDSFAGDMFRAS